MSSRTAVPALRRTLSGQIRGLRTSSSTLAAPGGRGAARSTDDARRPDGWDIKNVQPFQFDDTTTIGHMILERQREKVGTLMKIEQDRALLQGELMHTVYTPSLVLVAEKIIVLLLHPSRTSQSFPFPTT
jgi:hypothetical protein